MPVYIPPLRNFGATAGVSGDFVTTTGEEQIVFGEKTWVNDQAFLNNIYIEGTLSGDSSQLKIADNIVILNEGETLDGVALGESGFIVDRGIGDNSYILFRENTVGVVHDNRWVIDIGDGSEEIILYNNIPDDITFNGKVAVNNDLDVNFDLTLLSLNNNEGAILIVDNDGKVELASVTINDITGALLDLQEQIDDIEVGAGGFTPIAGGGITITPTGDDYIFSVDDYIGRTEVLTISGQIQTDVDDIVFDVNELQQRVDVIESDYLTSADISGISGCCAISQNITADLDVGAIEAGDVVEKGSTLDDFINQLIKTTFFPTFTNPSFSLSRNIAANLEIGTITDVTLTGNFNRGSIVGALDNGIWNPSLQQNPRAGIANLFVIDGNNNGTNNQFTLLNYQIVSGNQNWSATVSFDEGPQPLDSKNNPYLFPLGAGSLSANSPNTAGRRRYFWGTSEDIEDFDNSADIRALSDSALNPVTNTTFNINIPVGTQTVVFAYPATLRDVDSVEYVELSNAEVRGIFTQNIVSVESANNFDSIDYKVYTYTPVEPFGDPATYKVTI